MVNVLVLLFHLIGAAGSDDFYSIRLQGLGTELAGIVSDPETDALLYPAQVPSYTNSFLSASSPSGNLSLYFLRSSRLSIGGRASVLLDAFENIYYRYDSKSLVLNLISAYSVRPSISLGVAPRFQAATWRFTPLDAYVTNNYLSQSFALNLGFIARWEKWECNLGTLINSFFEYDSSSSEVDPDARFLIYGDNGIIQKLRFRFSFLNDRNWNWRCTIVPSFRWQWLWPGSSVALPIKTGFSDLTMKVGAEYLTKNLNFAAALSCSLISQNSLFLSFPFAFEYYVGPLSFRLGLGVKYENFSKNQNLNDFFTVGIGFAPNKWFRVDFLPYFSNLGYLPNWQVEVKFLW